MQPGFVSADAHRAGHAAAVREARRHGPARAVERVRESERRTALVRYALRLHPRRSLEQPAS